MKKSILLEDLFFNSNKETVRDIMNEILKYDEIIYKDIGYDLIVNPIELNEYISRYNDLVEDEVLFIANKYDKIIVFREVSQVINNQGIYQINHPFEEYQKQYEEEYDGMMFNLNLIKDIKMYYCREMRLSC